MSPVAEHLGECVFVRILCTVEFREEKSECSAKSHFQTCHKPFAWLLTMTFQRPNYEQINTQAVFFTCNAFVHQKPQLQA